MKNFVNRRDFLNSTLRLSGSLFLANSFFPYTSACAEEGADDHFFIQIFLGQGTDASYLFDARPLEMTANGKLANYIGKEPTLYKGTNGTTCWTTEIVAAMKSHLDVVSIVNGVVMSPAFDGHDQNSNMFFSGNPFGGESFVPHLNKFAGSGFYKRPIDAFQSGFLQTTVTNGAETVAMNADATVRMADLLTLKPVLDPAGKPSSFINSRLNNFEYGSGQFSKATIQYRDSFGKVPQLADLLKKVKLSASYENEEQKAVEFVAQLFKNKISRSMILSIRPKNGNIDCHDASSAKALPSTLQSLYDQVTNIFKYLRSTAYDEKRSLLDVTTVCLASEFSRTMRQKGAALDNTGTDHNPLNNSVLLAGKGIKGGLVVGTSDFQVSTENLSKAHNLLDKDNLKIMGRPFDFVKFESRKDLPEEMNIDDYLTVGSITNTMYSIFGVPESYYKKAKNNGNACPVLKGLLI